MAVLGALWRGAKSLLDNTITLLHTDLKEGSHRSCIYWCLHSVVLYAECESSLGRWLKYAEAGADVSVRSGGQYSEAVREGISGVCSRAGRLKSEGRVGGMGRVCSRRTPAINVHAVYVAEVGGCTRIVVGRGGRGIYCRHAGQDPKLCGRAPCVVRINLGDTGAVCLTMSLARQPCEDRVNSQRGRAGVQDKGQRV